MDCFHFTFKRLTSFRRKVTIKKLAQKSTVNIIGAKKGRSRCKDRAKEFGTVGEYLYLTKKGEFTENDFQVMKRAFEDIEGML